MSQIPFLWNVIVLLGSTKEFHMYTNIVKN